MTALWIALGIVGAAVWVFGAVLMCLGYMHTEGTDNDWAPFVLSALIMWPVTFAMMIAVGPLMLLVGYIALFFQWLDEKFCGPPT